MRYAHVRAADAERQDLEGGERLTFLATGADIGDRLSVYDSVLPQGLGAPLHFHERDDEVFYILSGEVEFGVADEDFVATAGDLVIAGPGVPRRFLARTDSRMLVLNTPAGPSEGFLREVASLHGPPTDQDRARFAERYGIHLLADRHDNQEKGG